MPQATVRWIQNKQFVGVDSSHHSLVMSTQDEGNAIGVRPSEMLLLALGACTAVDVVEILAKKRTPVSSLEIEVQGQQDPEPPWTFRKIHMRFRLGGQGLTPANVETAIRLSEEKYCSVSATLRATVQIAWEYELLDAAPPAPPAGGAGHPD